MRMRQVFLCVGFALSVNSSNPAWAQQLQPSSELEQLYHRLEAAEQRIHELEFDRSPAQFQRSEASIGTHAIGGIDAMQEPSIEQRVEGLEEEWKEFSEGLEKEAADAKKKPTQQWVGRIHTDYWAFPHSDAGSSFFETGNPVRAPRDRFLFRRLRLGLQGDILQTMRYKTEFDFAVGNDPVIKDAYIGWKELPFLQTVLLGSQKRPYGLDHLNSSRYNVFMERPFVVEAFNQDARRFGLASYGVSDDLAYNWRYGAYLSTDIQSTGAYLVTDDPGMHHYQAEFAGRFANTIWYDEASGGRGYAHWAVSGTIAGVDGTAGRASTARFRTRPEARTSFRWIDTGTIVGADNYELLGFEGVVNVGAVQLVGEFQSAWVQRDFGGPDVNFYGGYVYLAYFLTGEHEPWSREGGTIGRVKPFENFFLVDRCCGGRGFGLGAWQIAVRYSYGDYTDADILGGVGRSVTFGLNWWWTPYSRMQFNYIYGEIEDRYSQNIESSTGLPGGAVGPTEGDYGIIGARFAVDF